MKKSVLLGVSISAILSATGANAAGYTCEELIEYTSCNPGYYLASGACPDGYTYSESWCNDDFSIVADWYIIDESDNVTTFEERKSYCEDFGPYYGAGCMSNEAIADLAENYDSSPYYQLALEDLPEGTFITSAGGAGCNGCPAGYSCSGGDAAAVACAAGSYQPNTKQASCIDAPAGNYVADTGATGYTACAAGLYQPQSGQTSCVECPAGSYCAGTGLSAVSGECAIGTYSTGGATSALCTSCPASDLTDANGNVVSVTTESTGSTSSSACFVAKGTLFKDSKGIYKYTDNCDYGNYPALFEIPEEDTCPDGWHSAWDIDLNNHFCFKVPTTPSECAAISEDTDWYEGEEDVEDGCHCRDDLGFYVDDDGKVICF